MLVPLGHFEKEKWQVSALPKLTNTEPFAAWFVVTGDATPNGIFETAWYIRVETFVGVGTFLPEYRAVTSVLVQTLITPHVNRVVNIWTLRAPKGARV